VTIWYDASGLVDWTRPHLGGIERTQAGILDGLHRVGVPVSLVRFRPGTGEFERVAEGDLPAAVRRMCPWLGPPAPPPAPVAPTTVSPPPADAAADAKNRRRQRRRETIFGNGPEGAAFHAAWVTFRTAGRELVSHAGRRLGIRRSSRPLPASDPPAEAVMPAEAGKTGEAAACLSSVPFLPGDVLLSLGGTFATPGHPAAVDAARSRGVRIVRLVYDMVPVTKPQWLTPRTIEVAWLRHVVERSDVVLTISACTRRELVAYCQEAGFTPPRIELIRLGDVLESARAVGLPPPLPRFVPERPFLLCVSSLNVRKNHRCLYDAWSVLASDRGAECPDLLCLGMSHDHVTELVHEIRNDRAVNRHLHLLDGVRDEELDWYYRSCIATIYPSKHEGWGLPVAESLGYGKLCLASSAASMPEISDLPEFFAPHDVPRVVALVNRCLDDPAWRIGREERIRREFRPTTWADTAAATLTAAGLAPAPGVAA